MQKNILLESNINEIYNLINENQNSFDSVWFSIKEKINNAVKNIKNKEEAVEFVTNVYKKIKHLPDSIRKKTIKYTIALLISDFGFTAIMAALPGEVKSPENNIEKVEYQSIKTHPTQSSDSLKNFIKKEEKLSLRAYTIKSNKSHPSGDGMITVGWGHAERKGHSKFKKGQRITKELAQKLFDEDIKESEEGLNRILNDWDEKGIKLQITQKMYDAMVSMIFNMGISNFRKSDFIQLVKQNKFQEAKNKILSTNITYPGHKFRRQKEAEMFDNGLIALMLSPTLREYIRREITKLLS